MHVPDSRGLGIPPLSNSHIGSIARVTRLWLFLFQSLRPLVGLVSCYQRYQIINLSYLGKKELDSWQSLASLSWRRRSRKKKSVSEGPLRWRREAAAAR